MSPDARRRSGFHVPVQVPVVLSPTQPLRLLGQQANASPAMRPPEPTAGYPAAAPAVQIRAGALVLGPPGSCLTAVPIHAKPQNVGLVGAPVVSAFPMQGPLINFMATKLAETNEQRRAATSPPHPSQGPHKATLGAAVGYCGSGCGAVGGRGSPRQVARTNFMPWTPPAPNIPVDAHRILRLGSPLPQRAAVVQQSSPQQQQAVSARQQNYLATPQVRHVPWINDDHFITAPMVTASSFTVVAPEPGSFPDLGSSASAVPRGDSRALPVEEKLRQWLSTIPMQGGQPHNSAQDRDWDEMQISEIVVFAQESHMAHLPAEEIYRRFVEHQVDLADEASCY